MLLCCRCLLSVTAAVVAGQLGGAGINTESTWPASAQLWQTSESGDRLTKLGNIAIEPEFDFAWADGPTILVKTKPPSNAQEIVGFGGAFTEAASIMFASLSPADREKILQMYWGTGEIGLGYTLGRVHINSCDFSPSSYALDPVPNDVELSAFDISHDKVHMIPFIVAAQTHQPELKIIAAPWSPPAWMKTPHYHFGCTGDMAGMCGSGEYQCIQPSYRDSWALYFVKFIQAYVAAGVTSIWAVSAQNEPEHNGRWEVCLYTAAQEADFVTNFLGPKLKEAFPNIKLFVHDGNKKDLVQRTKELLYWDNKAADKYVDGIAFHWYDGDLFDNVAATYKTFSNKILLSTEATYIYNFPWKASAGTGFWACADPKVGDWRMGMGYAHDIMGDLKAGASGWIDWNLLLDSQGGPNHAKNFCDAAIMVDKDTKELYVHPQYYFIGHFSKFILPGYSRRDTRVEGSGYPHAPGSFPFINKRRGVWTEYHYGMCDGSDLLDAVSFSNPSGSSFVTVVLNCGETSIDFKLRIAHDADNFRALRGHIPGRSIQTYTYSVPVVQANPAMAPVIQTPPAMVNVTGAPAMYAQSRISSLSASKAESDSAVHSKLDIRDMDSNTADQARTEDGHSRLAVLLYVGGACAFVAMGFFFAFIAHRCISSRRHRALCLIDCKNDRLESDSESVDAPKTSGFE